MTLIRLFKAECYKLNMKLLFAPLLLLLLFWLYFSINLFSYLKPALTEELLSPPMTGFASLLYLSEFGSLFYILYCFILAVGLLQQEQQADCYLLYRLHGLGVVPALFAKYLLLLLCHGFAIFALMLGYGVVFISFAKVHGTEVSDYVSLVEVSMFAKFALLSGIGLTAIFGLCMLLQQLWRSMILAVAVFVLSITLTFMTLGHWTPVTFVMQLYDVKGFYLTGGLWHDPLLHLMLLINSLVAFLLALIGGTVYCVRTRRGDCK